MTALAAVRCLVLAKAPEPGRVKTRLGATVGMSAAAELAAAALLDTIAAATAAYGAGRCVCALDGDLDHAPSGPELAAALDGWTLVGQHGSTLGERIATALAGLGTGPVVQVGMDTPQLTPEDLAGLVRPLAGHDAVLGPADDGGWWGLALRDPAHGSALAEVSMSLSTTGRATREALRGLGLSVATGPGLRDVDELGDAELVARSFPYTRFAAAWQRLAPEAVA